MHEFRPDLFEPPGALELSTRSEATKSLQNNVQERRFVDALSAANSELKQRALAWPEVDRFLLALSTLEVKSVRNVGWERAANEALLQALVLRERQRAS